MMQLLITAGPHTVDQALELTQRTFGSCCRDRAGGPWVDYSAARRRFYVTHAGVEAMQRYEAWDGHRKNARAPFSKYVPSTVPAKYLTAGGG
jgi:hypothetical protein